MPALTTLVIGAGADAREAAIAQTVDPALPTAVILEGMPGAEPALAELAPSHPLLTVTRIAPGCICCGGNLTMRVTLNRILRQQPQRLFIGLADFTHLERIVLFLKQEPYDKFLSLTKEMHVESRKS